LRWSLNNQAYCLLVGTWAWCHGQWACLHYAMDVSKALHFVICSRWPFMQVALHASPLGGGGRRFYVVCPQLFMCLCVFGITLAGLKHCTNVLCCAGQPELQCEVTTQPGGFVWRSTAAVAAVLLYTQAGFMATSPTFRLTSGGLLGITGFAVIFLMIIVR